MKTIKKAYFVGIGGISMCALARILQSFGTQVFGSDIDKVQLEKLSKSGFCVYFGHNKNNVKGDIDLLVYSSSIAPDNPEILKAKELGIKICNRGELLGLIAKQYKNVIAVSGAHGKTTTTSMIFEIFKTAKLNPTAHIGGIVRSENSNVVLGGKKYFITEACEFKDNFLYLCPTVGVVTNIEAEHMDYFKTTKRLKQSFAKFVSNCQYVVAKKKIVCKNKILIGKTGFHSQNHILCDDGCYKFDLMYKQKKLFDVKLKIIGEYNVENAVFACAVAKHFGIKDIFIKTALENFEGVQRRFDIIRREPMIIHDYAHHPSELKAVINAVKPWTKGKLIVVFQPHTYTRTLSLMTGFYQSFCCCDELLILKTYSAREKEILGGRAIDLYQNLKKRLSSKIYYFDRFEDCKKFLDKKIKKQDKILFLGAGNIEILAKCYKQNEN